MKNKPNKELKEKKSEENERSYRVWFYIVPSLMIVLVVAYFIVSALLGYVNNPVFEYKGLLFDKVQTGGTTLYHYAYHVRDGNGRTVQNNINLRIDPRKNDVPVEGKITFEGDNRIYSAMNITSLINCSNILRDVSFLPYFLVNNFLKVTIGVSDEADAKATNSTYITCEKYPDTKVVMIQAANETKIIRQGNCFTINVANCQLLEASEKFEVQAIIDMRDAAMGTQ